MIARLYYHITRTRLRSPFASSLDIMNDPFAPQEYATVWVCQKTDNDDVHKLNDSKPTTPTPTLSNPLTSYLAARKYIQPSEAYLELIVAEYGAKGFVGHCFPFKEHVLVMHAKTMFAYQNPALMDKLIEFLRQVISNVGVGESLWVV